MDELKLDKDKLFEIICKHKDSNPSNLNKVFESYGCNTLEAKVPVVQDTLVDELKEAGKEQQLYGTLSFKAHSAALKMEGRMSRTRDKVLKVVEINGETVITTGETRERSPADETELDKDIDLYMRERARLKTNKYVDEQVDRVASMELTSADVMDQDLDSYMKEAVRLRAQKKLLEEQSDRMDTMMKMEDLDDLDTKGGFIKF